MIDKELTGDLHDDPKDKEKLRPDEGTIDLPDLNDIPGYKDLDPPAPHTLGDPTVASADEEGYDVFNDDPSQVILNEGGAAGVSTEERDLLRNSDHVAGTDDVRLHRAELDEKDEEGEALNERSSGRARSGSDLDVPGAELDEPMDRIGEEDEENNHYSMGSDDNDLMNEGTP